MRWASILVFWVLCGAVASAGTIAPVNSGTPTNIAADYDWTELDGFEQPPNIPGTPVLNGFMATSNTGQVFAFSSVNQVVLVPEPGGVALLGLGLLVLARRKLLIQIKEFAGR